MDTPNRKDNLTQLLGFLKKNGYAGKELRLDDFDARMQDESIRRNLYNALSRNKVPDIGSWNEFSSMVKKENKATTQAQPSTQASSTPIVPNSPLLPSQNKANKNTISIDWTKPIFPAPTIDRTKNPGVPTLVPSREHPHVGRELAFVSPAEVTNPKTGKKHYKETTTYPDEIGEDNTRKAIDNYTQAKASEANRLDRKIEAQLQDIEKQQKELEARLNKRAKELEAEREDDGWFVNFIRSQPARGMDPMSTINRLTNDGKDQDEEYIGISSALHNLRKQKEKLLATKKSMQEDASFGSFLKNAGRGFLDTVTDTRIWDGAEGDLREAGLAIKAIGKLELQKKFNSGQATKEDAELLRTLYKGQLKLTPAEEALLNSKAGRAYVDAITKEAIGYGYGAGETTANMLPFIRDIALSPVNGLGRTVATNVAKSALKRGLSRAATKAISRTARVVGDIALEGAGTALTTGMGGTLKGAADEQIGDINYDVDSKTGQIVYGGRTNQEENFLKALGKSLVRQALEYGTEATDGVYIGTLMKPINKYGGKLLTKTLGDKAVSAVEKFFARMEKTSVGKAVNSVGEQVHYDGLPGEYLEEVYNNLLNAVTIGDMKLDTNSNNGVFNPEINKTIIIGLMGAPMATVSLKVGSIVAQDTKTQAMGLRAFGYKQWQEMKTLIGNSDDVSKTISEWAEQNPNATSNQKKAVMRYAVATAMEDAMTVRQALEQKENSEVSPDASSTEAGVEPQPIGQGAFGAIYDQFKGKAQEAFRFLSNKASGYLKGVFHRDEIGDIDLAWGNAPTNHSGKGLAHILRKHVELLGDFADEQEAFETIEDVVKNGDVSKGDDTWNIEKGNYRVVVAKDENGNWVLTAFDYVTTPKEKLKRKKDSATTLTPSQTADQSGGAGAVAPHPSSSASEGKDNTFNPNSDNSKRYEQGNGVILKREDGTSVRAQIVSEENEDGKIEVASSEGAIQGRDRVVYLTREELDQMYQGSFDIDTPDASSNEETQLSDTSIDSTPASPTPNSDSPIGRPMTEEEAVSFVDKITTEAEEAPELELTAENWDKEFGDNGVVDTPIGQVHMGEHQFLKMMRQGRNSKLGMIKPTLTNPDIIIEVTSQAKEGQETERASSHVYVKAFTKPNGERFYYFTSISVQKDSAEVVISNQERSKGQIAKIMKDGSVLWMRTDNASETSDVAQGLYSPQGNQLSDPTSEGTVAPQSLPSEDKDTTLSAPEDNTHTQDGTDTTQEAVSDTPHSEESSEEHEWDELSKQVGDESAREIISSDISDLEAERKKLQKEISKPKGQTREEKIQYVIGRRERLQSIDAEIEGLQRVLQVPQMRIAQAEAQEQEQNRIKAEEARRQEEADEQARAEKKRQESERLEEERLRQEKLQGVPDWSDDTPQNARARGYRRSNGESYDRQERISNGVSGNEVQVKFSNEDMPTGRIMVIEADELQPSHIQGQRNPNFFIDEAQPKDRIDDASVLSARRIAGNMRPEEITGNATAYTGAPIVNSRGEVIQGNNRSDALRYMYQHEQEQAQKYKQYLLDNAERLGLSKDAIMQMNKPVLVTALEVSDNDAIRLGQMSASDTESGGIERIKPMQTITKMGDNIQSFSRILLSGDEDMDLSSVVDHNGADALKWMHSKGYITDTQYQSAFKAKGELTGEAKNDLINILSEVLFNGAGQQLRDDFEKLPAKAKKAILATIYRDLNSPDSERIIREVQDSIRAYAILQSNSKDFSKAKNTETALRAIDDWLSQQVFDDVSGEIYIPNDRLHFSNFALHLAGVYRGATQAYTSSVFNALYDDIQGLTSDIFDDESGKKHTLTEAIKRQLNIDYNGKTTSSDVAHASQNGSQRERGGSSDYKERNGTEGTSEPSRTGGRSQTDSREVESEKPTFLDVIRTLYEKGKEVASKLFGRSYFDVADTSNLLKKLGLTGDKFTIRYGVISRHFGKDAQHKLPLSVWSQLPKALNTPLIVTKYYTNKTKTKQKGYRIYTAIQLEDGAFVVAGVEVKNAGRNLEVNAIDTVFSRNNIIGTQEEIVYESKEMTPEQRTLLDGHNPHRYSDTQESSNASDSKGSKKTTDLTRSEKEAVIAQAEQELEGLQSEASSLRRKAYQAMRDYYESGAVPDMTEEQFVGEARYMFVGRENRDELTLIHAPGLQDILPQLDELANKIRWYKLLIRNSKKALNTEQNTEGKVESEDARKSEDNSTEGIRFRRSQELQEVNERFNEQLEVLNEETANSTILSLGSPSNVLLSAGVADKPMRLYGNKVIKKMKKHGFSLSELRDLPRAVANPIAVFSTHGDGSHAILTELTTEQGNFLVTVNLGKNRDIEFNIISSAFGKGASNIIDWFNKGFATYINKEKAQDYLGTPTLNVGAVSNQELSDATKVIKEFENPNIEENAFDDDILFRGRYVEGQLGYTERADGTPISDNAKYAEEAGKFPASLFKKKYGISPADFNMLNDLGLIEISEWHHTGATFRETDYYSWVDNAIFDDGYNSRQGYDINGEYEYNEQGEATYVGEDENPSMPLSEWYKQNKKAIKSIADAYKAGEWTWEREDSSVGLHRIKNREDAEDRMIETHFRKEERQYRNMHWGEYPKSLKDLFSAMLKWDENAHYEDIEAEAERLANEFYDAHIEETLEADRKKVEEGEAQNRAIREKNLSSESKETALMVLAQLYGMDEQEAYNKISSSSWYNRGSLRRRSTSSDEASEHNPLHTEMEREATNLAHSMGEEVVVVHNEEELVDILGEDGARQARGAKGFYLPKSGKVVIILSNNTDVADVLETIFHEFVGHKGLQEYVGKEEFTAFIDRAHKGLHAKALREIHDEAKQIFKERKGTSRAVSYQDAVREATEEYIARLSERGFSDRESRSTWQKIVDAFRDMISRAKLNLGWNIQDRDIRYILWKSFQMKQKQVAILAEAGDIAMRHRLGLSQKVKVTEGIKERRATSNDVGTNRYNSEMRSVSSELDNKLAITTLNPSTEIPVVQTEKRSVSTAEAKQAIESLPKQVVTMDGYALNVSKKTKHKLGNSLSNSTREDYRQALTLLTQIVGNSVLIEEHRNRVKIDGERKADNPNDSNIEKVQRFYGAITIGGVTYRVKTTAIVSANTEQGTRMHNYDITEIELLQPETPVSRSSSDQERSNSISLAKLLNGVEFSYEPERKILDEMQGGTEDIRFRQGNNSQTSWNESEAQTEYNRTTRITDENGNKSKSANLLWRLREAYQDSMLSLKALQDALAKNALGRDLRDFEDAYTAENAMGSKNLSEMEHYDARYVKPLTDAISELMKEGASYEDILNYLRAKHGLERNEYYNAQDRATAKDKWDSKEALKQQKNPNYQPKEFEDKGEFKDYSGLTGLTGSSEDFTKLAQDMVEEFENKFNTDALWTSVRNANQKTLELGRQKNLIGKQTYEHIKGMFEYYVPLRGWDSNRAEDEWEYLDGAGTMSGNSIRKRAKGRTSVSDDPIAMMIKLAEDTIRQGNRNMMKLKFLNLAENADDKLLQYSRAWFQKKIDQEGNEYWELVTPDIDDDASPEEVSEALLEFNQNMNKLRELGEATQYPPKDSRKNITFDKNGSLGERKQHTVTVYRGGQLYTIFVNGNPRAAQAINGSINAGQYSGQIEKIVGPFNRWISAMHTSYNPEFIITNAVRDFQHATFMIFAQEGLGSKYMKDFQKQYIQGLKRSIGLYKRWRSGTLDLSRNEDKMFHDFMINGGQTGYTQISKVEDLKKKVEWELKKAKGEAGRMKVGFEILQEGLELFNGAIELNTRFATFVASRKSGRSIERSISDAKNITVNFNKKGAGGYGAAFFQALYIFFNPAVQALEQSVRVSRKHPKRVAAMIGTMATLAYLQPILFELIGAAAGGDDDDEDAYDNINQNSRLSSLIIRNPLDTSTYINLPISPELKPFFTLGSALAEVQRGAMTTSEATVQILQGTTSLLPLDPAGGNGDKKWINIVPSVVQPLEQVAVNTNYYGESIYKDNGFNKLDPEWTKAKDANPIFTKTSEILNEWSGGNKVRKGEIDINPEKVEHIVEGFTGGAGRATNALFKTFMMPFDSDMRKLNNTVMLRKFYKAIPQAKEGMLSPIIWKISDQFKAMEHDNNGYRKELRSNDPSEVSEYTQKLYDLKLSSEYNFYIRYRRSINRLQDLRKKYREAKTDEERKGISDLMNSIQEIVLKAYKEEQKRE